MEYVEYLVFRVIWIVCGILILQHCIVSFCIVLVFVCFGESMGRSYWCKSIISLHPSMYYLFIYVSIFILSIYVFLLYLKYVYSFMYFVYFHLYLVSFFKKKSKEKEYHKKKISEIILHLWHYFVLLGLCLHCHVSVLLWLVFCLENQHF